VISKKENDKLIKGVYEGEYNENHLPEFVFLFTFFELQKEVDKGYGSIKELKGKKQIKAAKFRTNINIFSSSKTYQNVRDLQNFIEFEGQKLSFRDFEKVAKGINSTYNKAWLKAELSATKQMSISAKQWDDIQETKDTFPMLKYVTVGDANVRPEHAAYDGIIKPVDDSFWSTHMPPNDWGCRCEVQQLAEGKNTNLKDHLKDYNKSVPKEKQVTSLKNPSKLFANNPGKDEFIFDPKVHPYFKNISRSKKNNLGFGFE